MIPCRRAIRCAIRIDDVSSDAQEHRQHDADGGDHERGEQRPAEVVDLEHPVRHLGGDQEDERVGDQNEQEAEHERQRQPQRSEHAAGSPRSAPRRSPRRRGRPRSSGHRRRAGARRQPSARCRWRARDDEREEPQPRSLGPPGTGLAVGLLGLARHQVPLVVRPRRRGDGTGSGRTPRAPPSSPPSSRRAVPSARRP